MSTKASGLGTVGQDDLYPRVIALARAQEVSLEPRASETSLASFEAKHDVVLPPQMRQFYALVGGMEPGTIWSDAMMSLWALSHVRPISEELPEPYYEEYRRIDDVDRWFCFADHIIGCDIYAVRLGSDPAAESPVISVCGGHDVRASSFADFVARCLDDPYSLT